MTPLDDATPLAATREDAAVLDDATPLEAISFVTVLSSRDRKGWPRHEYGGRVSKTALHIALTREYRSDAHAAMYTSSIARRLNGDAVECGMRVVVRSWMFDLDCVEVHGTDQPVPDSWRADFLVRAEALDRVHPGLFYYETRGGARIVVRVHEPMVIGTREDARVWSCKCAVAQAYLSRRFGLICDPQCVSWNWLFRLPRVVRKGQLEPEHWPMYGDPSSIAVLQISEERSDVDAARRTHPNRFDVSRKLVRGSTLAAPCGSDGRGLFYHLLDARGSILGEHAHDSAFVVRCPNERAHTTGCTGDRSTLLYLPGAGEDLGFVFCLHAHCSSLGARDWLKMFSQQELETARRAATRVA